MVSPTRMHEQVVSGIENRKIGTTEPCERLPEAQCYSGTHRRAAGDTARHRHRADHHPAGLSTPLRPDPAMAGPTELEHVGTSGECRQYRGADHEHRLGQFLSRQPFEDHSIVSPKTLLVWELCDPRLRVVRDSRRWRGRSRHRINLYRKSGDHGTAFRSGFPEDRNQAVALPASRPNLVRRAELGPHANLEGVLDALTP